MNDLFMSFVPGDSVLHRLDPRTKIIGLMLVSFCILDASSFADMFFIALVFTVLVLSCRLPLGHFVRSVRPMLFFFAILFLMQLFFTEGREVWHFSSLSVTYEGLLLGTTITLRFVFLLLFAALITATTSPSRITSGIERLLRPLPLRYVGITSHDMAMMMSLSIYFVPMFYDSFTSLREAQISRGLDIRKEPVKAIFSIVVPLVSGSVRRVEEVALAMESRCYQSTGRSSMHEMKFTGKDHVSFAMFVFLILFLTVL
ncbi:energy-coupling factor transport system permease protein [Methanolobus profundi]|uniref:Energy-coupling factor transport system permease protein n=2 Tax=Methanolobus profundi TaxID=487685 RepID=A0A1I4R4R4_9EURY|nr:energy-coupling factor transport system permease protein [Methanolobus profundi]